MTTFINFDSKILVKKPVSKKTHILRENFLFFAFNKHIITIIYSFFSSFFYVEALNQLWGFYVLF